MPGPPAPPRHQFRLRSVPPALPPLLGRGSSRCGQGGSPRAPHTSCHGALPGISNGLLAGEGSYKPEKPEPGLLPPRGSPPTSLGRPPGKAPGGKRLTPAAPAQCGSQPAQFEQHRVRVLT